MIGGAVGPRGSAVGRTPAERRRAGRQRVGPTCPVGEADAPAGDRVEVGGHPPAAQVAHRVRPHRRHRPAAAVHDDQPQPGHREHLLQEPDRRGAGGLRAPDRRRARTDRPGQLPLTQVGPSARSPHEPADIEVLAHGSSVVGRDRPEQTSEPICGQGSACGQPDTRPPHRPPGQIPSAPPTPLLPLLEQRRTREVIARARASRESPTPLLRGLERRRTREVVAPARASGGSGRPLLRRWSRGVGAR